MSGYCGNDRESRGRYDRDRDERSDDRGGRRGREWDHNRHRSRSPQQGGPSNRGRGENYRTELRGNYGGRERRDDGGRNNSTAPVLPPLPDSVPIPEGTSAKIPYAEHVPRGKIGRRVMVSANHHMIQSLPVIKIYQYDLRFRVPESSQAIGSAKVTASQMARVLLNSTLVDFLSEHFIFDGVSLGWSPKELMPIGKSLATTISLGTRRDGKPNEVEIEVKKSATLKIRDLVGYLREGRTELNTSGNPALEDTLKWLNALFRDDPARKMISRPGSNAFFKRTRETSMSLASTGGILEALRGIHQTVLNRFTRLTVCVDTATTPFWTPGISFIDCVCALSGERSPQNLENRFNSDSDFFFAACGMLLGCFFNVRHLKEDINTKKFRFLSWSSQNANLTIFDERMNNDTTRSTSVTEYFLRKYNIKLLFPGLPLAHTRDGDFPLELCYTAPGERYRGVLQGTATADFIKFATSSAYVRRQQIDASLRNLAWHQNPTLQAHGISVDPKMMEVKAVVLDAPELEYGSGRISPRDGSWNLRGLRYLRPASIKSWGLISFISQADRLDTLGNEIIQSFNAVGIVTPRHPPSVIVGNSQGDIESIINKVISRTEQDFHSPPDVIFVILKTNSIQLYSAIKQALDIRQGIASQVMVSEKVFKERGLQQYLANISMKVNVKLGGMNCTIRQSLFQGARWMLIGGDISSPSPSALKRDPPPPSTAALCGTFDKDCTSYIGNATMQQSMGANIIERAGPMFKDVLTRYRLKNNNLMPEHIIYYRDGASESEFQAIIDKEGRELRRLCQDSNTKITIIVAIKRHHTRFFAEGGLATKLGNVPPGTIVENSSSRNDAFVVAHRDLIGTKRPTRYVSIIDENKLSADDFHTLTYQLCSTYARATTAVAVVPPVYYADQICERARLHLQDTPDGNQFLPQVHQNLTWNMYWQ